MMILSSVAGLAVLGFSCGMGAGIMIALFLRRRRVVRRAAVQSTTRFMYSGNLKQTNLLDAIQFLELGRREGVLHVYVGRRKGYITFAAGQIVDAFFRNTIGKEAIFQMLELDYGDFFFESKTISQPRVITESMLAIALEWDARRYGGTSDGGEADDAAATVETAPETVPEARGAVSGDVSNTAPAVEQPSGAALEAVPKGDDAVFEQAVSARGDTPPPQKAGDPSPQATNGLKALLGKQCYSKNGGSEKA
jgi:hypothetical protein